MLNSEVSKFKTLELPLISPYGCFEGNLKWFLGVCCGIPLRFARETLEFLNEFSLSYPQVTTKGSQGGFKDVEQLGF